MKEYNAGIYKHANFTFEIFHNIKKRDGAQSTMILLKQAYQGIQNLTLDFNYMTYDDIKLYKQATMPPYSSMFLAGFAQITLNIFTWSSLQDAVDQKLSG